MVHYLSIIDTRLLQFCGYIQLIPFPPLTENDRNILKILFISKMIECDVTEILYNLHLSLCDLS